VQALTASVGNACLLIRPDEVWYLTSTEWNTGMRLSLAFVRDQADGALSYAAVPRVCLGQTTPPLCRYAKCTADLILRAWLVFHRYRPAIASVVGA
jgi:hypothetical protein